MAVVTLRPNSTVDPGAATPTGAATLHQALSDDSDSSYVTTNGFAVEFSLGLDDMPPGSELVNGGTVRLRCGNVTTGELWLLTLEDGDGREIGGPQQFIFSSGGITTVPVDFPDLEEVPKVIRLYPVVTGTIRLYELYVDVSTPVAPEVTVVAPSGQIDGNRPTILWTRNLDPDGGSQTHWQARVVYPDLETVDDFDRPDENPISKGGEWLGKIRPTDGDIAVVDGLAVGPGTALYDTVLDAPTVAAKIETLGDGVGVWAGLAGYPTLEPGMVRAEVVPLPPDEGIEQFRFRITTDDGEFVTDGPFGVEPGDWIGLRVDGDDLVVLHGRDGNWDVVLSTYDLPFPFPETPIPPGAVGLGLFDDAAVSEFAVGFGVPGQAFWDSGVMPGTATSVQVEEPLPNGEYVAQARVAQTVGGSQLWSEWGESAFSVAVVPPDPPVLTLTPQGVNGRIRVEVARGEGVGATATTWEVQASDDGATWRTLVTIPAVGVGPWTVYDREAGNGRVRHIRARGTAVVSGETLSSAWVSGTATWQSQDVWLKSATDPTLDLRVPAGGLFRVLDFGTVRRESQAAEHEVLGAPYPVVTYPQYRSSESGELVLMDANSLQRRAIQALLDEQTPILLQFPLDAQEPDRWIAHTGTSVRGRLIEKMYSSPQTHTIPWREVARPAVVAVT